jgi:hypothetical protein
MKILVLTYHFAPFNHIGAVRATKMVKYLLREGHDVRVVAAADQPFPRTLLGEVDENLVTLVPCPHLDRGTHQFAASQAVQSGKSSSRAVLLRWLRRLLRWPYELYKTLLWYPDNVRFWRRRLEREGHRLIADFAPDIILASAPPFTPLLAASNLARAHAIPWVCELRDLWVDYHNYRYPRWRRRLEERLETQALASAAGFVTVSPPLAATLARRYRQPIAVIPNGFDAADYCFDDDVEVDRHVFTIVYTGTIYDGKQNIEPVFAALAELRDLPLRVELRLYGRALARLLPLARRWKVDEYVIFGGQVPYREALAIQRRADLLLLLLWNDQSQKGVYTGKLFEYLGARRPILCVGEFENVASDLVKARNAGYTATDARGVAEIVRHLAQQKHALGRCADLPPETCRGFSREEQARELAGFLSRFAATPASRKSIAGERGMSTRSST